MNKNIALLVLYLLFQNAIAQEISPKTDIWKTLFKVQYGDWQQDFNPKFTPAIKALHNKEITIKGFLIPLTEQSKHSYFLLSAFPFDQCFYCGKAGPETVIEVSLKKAVKATDKMITVKGVLLLNEHDPTHLFYIMDEGQVISE
jgi:hypothetical protein